MKAILLAGAASLALAGCGPTLDNILERDPVKEAITGCNTITAALNVLTPNKHRLNPAQIETVDRVGDVSEPICAPDEPPASAADLITDLASQITVVMNSLGEDV